MRSWFLVLVWLLAACQTPGRGAAPPALPPLGAEASPDFAESTPSQEGLDPERLMALADWVEHSDAPIFSILVSRRGKLVFELYTSGLSRDEAHYLMSVTKSFTSTLAGMAIDQGLLPGPEAPMSRVLPRQLFASEADVERFSAVTLRDVLAMSALDAPVFPHQKTPEARERLTGLMHARNRAAFALRQPLLPEPGRSYLYTDVTPQLTIGAISYASHQSAFEYARDHLLGPLGFRNAEWMHQDASGLDNGAFGLRVRPIDMQKLGILYLHGGVWNGRQLLSRAWVDACFTPWLASKPGGALDYGWGWWTGTFNGALAHLAVGWKGQRIAVFPAEELVVTMTGAMEQGEQAVFAKVVSGFILPAVRHPPPAPEPEADRALRRKLEAVRTQTQRLSPALEPRMVPSVEPKGQHHGLIE